VVVGSVGVVGAVGSGVVGVVVIEGRAVVVTGVRRHSLEKETIDSVALAFETDVYLMGFVVVALAFVKDAYLMGFVVVVLAFGTDVYLMGLVGVGKRVANNLVLGHDVYSGHLKVRSLPVGKHIAFVVLRESDKDCSAFEVDIFVEHEFVFA
jgi:hypothetical protein